MELKDTIELMSSLDYRERFKAEYYQLAIRIKKLTKTLEKIKAGNNDFTPATNLVDNLSTQLEYMSRYLDILKVRAITEKIDLAEV